MANTRIGYDLRQVKPDSLNIPVTVRSGQFVGANTLVGVRTADGLVENVVDGTAYNKVLLSCDEFDAADGALSAPRGIVDDAVLLCEGTGFTAADLFVPVFAVDGATVSTDNGGGTRAQAGVIVEVVSATRVRVHVR